MFIEIYDEALDEHEDEQQQQTSSEDHAIVDSVVRECRNEMERRKWIKWDSRNSQKFFFYLLRDGSASTWHTVEMESAN